MLNSSLVGRDVKKFFENYVHERTNAQRAAEWVALFGTMVLSWTAALGDAARHHPGTMPSHVFGTKDLGERRLLQVKSIQKQEFRRRRATHQRP